MANGKHFIVIVVCYIILCFYGHLTEANSAERTSEVDFTTSNSQYTLVTSKLSWSEARDTCTANGGHLVFLNSAHESQVLQDAASEVNAPSSDYWIGLVNVGYDTWTWLDGTGLDYTNWKGSHGREDDDCITLHMGTQEWRQKDCSRSNNYICEKDVSVCPDGFHLFESSCYRVISDPLIDGISARNACAEAVSGSHLAFIESQSEQTFLKTLVEGTGVNTDFWFGLTFTSDEQHPQWLDGRPLGNFTAWDGYGVFDEKSPCVRLRERSDFLWNDRPCATNYFGYICEIEKGNEDASSITPTKTVPTQQTKEAVFNAGPVNMAAPMGNAHLGSKPQLSLFSCAAYCLQNDNCASFNYQSAEGQAKLESFCELYSMHFPNDELTKKPGYRYYRV